MTQPSEGRQVLVVGLGNMGSALAEALMSAGWRVTGWNRTAGKSQALRQKGVSTAGSVAEAASAADVTIVCVSDHAATEEIIFNDAVGTALNDKLLVQLSTISADQSRETAAWAEAHGVTYLESSILGLPSDVTEGSAIVVYAGPQEAFDEHKEMLFALGGNPKHVSEDIGAAVTFDKIIYACGYGAMQSFIQGAAIAHAKGFPIEAYTDTVVARMPAYAGNMKMYGAKIAARNHDDVACRLDVHAAAFAKSLAMCRDLGVDDRLPATMMHTFERAIAAGHGDKELSALFEVLIHDDG